MQVAEPEERSLEGSPPRRRQNMGGVVGGGGVESVEVGLEVVVEGVDLEGE